MENWERQELKETVKDIPKHRLDLPIKELWRIYGSDYNYGTFRKYLLLFAISKKTSGFTTETNQDHKGE